MTDLSAPQQINAQLGKQYSLHVTVANANGTARLVLWKDQISSLEEDNSYEIRNLKVYTVAANCSPQDLTQFLKTPQT